MKKTAETEHPIHELIAERWSPRAFAQREVEPAKLASLFEAARWAPSCFNAQPWRFLVASRADAAGFERLAACLVEGNAWAREAPVLSLAVARVSFEHNEKPNKHAWHDVGLAMGCLVLQAQALGLASHQMGGFDAARAKLELGIPDGFEAIAMCALGYAGSADLLPAALAERERAPRERKELREIVFGPAWETAPAF